MKDYETIFRNLFEQLKQSSLPINKKIVFTNEEGLICAGHLTFNQEEATFTFNGVEFISINIKENYFALYNGINSFNIKRYDLKDILTKNERISKTLDFMIDATNRIILKSQIKGKNDLEYLKDELKLSLGDKITIGLYGKDKDKIVGVYLLDDLSLNQGIDFTIIYDKAQGLVLYTESGNYAQNLEVLGKIGLAISTIMTDSSLFGQPSHFYNIEKTPCLEWKFIKNKSLTKSL